MATLPRKLREQYMRDDDVIRAVKHSNVASSASENEDADHNAPSPPTMGDDDDDDENQPFLMHEPFQEDVPSEEEDIIVPHKATLIQRRSRGTVSDYELRSVPNIEARRGVMEGRRCPFQHKGNTLVNSQWKPRLKTSNKVVPLSHQNIPGWFPRNVQPVIIRTKFNQGLIAEETVQQATTSTHDQKLFALIKDLGRIVAAKRWSRYLELHATIDEFDLGTFVSLDTLLVTFAFSFYTDMQNLLRGERRKIRVKDVNYLLRLWARRSTNASKIYFTDSTFLEAAQAHEGHS